MKYTLKFILKSEQKKINAEMIPIEKSKRIIKTENIPEVVCLML